MINESHCMLQINHNKNEEEKSQFHWSWRTISTWQWKLKYSKDFTWILGSSQSMCFLPGYVLAIITPVYFMLEYAINKQVTSIDTENTVSCEGICK